MSRAFVAAFAITLLGCAQDSPPDGSREPAPPAVALKVGSERPRPPLEDATSAPAAVEPAFVTAAKAPDANGHVDAPTAGQPAPVPAAVPVPAEAVPGAAADVHDAGSQGGGRAASEPAPVPPAEATDPAKPVPAPSVRIVVEPGSSGVAPHRVRFRAEVEGLEPPLQFHWSLGNGRESTEQVPPPQVYGAGRYDVILSVTDAQGRVKRASVTIDSRCKGC